MSDGIRPGAIAPIQGVWVAYAVDRPASSGTPPHPQCDRQGYGPEVIDRSRQDGYGLMTGAIGMMGIWR